MICKYGLTIPLLAIVLLVTACGIKPNSLDAPEGAENKTFPATYPAPKNK